MSTSQTPFERSVFEFLQRKYVQSQDDRQKEMGLVYTTAETHDLAYEIARFVGERNWVKREIEGGYQPTTIYNEFREPPTTVTNQLSSVKPPRKD